MQNTREILKYNSLRNLFHHAFNIELKEEQQGTEQSQSSQGTLNLQLGSVHSLNSSPLMPRISQNQETLTPNNSLQISQTKDQTECQQSFQCRSPSIDE